MHTIGFAKFGVILSCIAGVGSATAFTYLTGWNSFFHLWYVNLAILIIAVPIDLRLKTFLALIFISVYCSMFLFFYDVKPIYQIEKLTESLLGISNILGSLLILGLPMGMYSIFLEQERNRSEKLLHNIIPKSIADQLKKDSKLISMDNPVISVLFADIVSFTVMSEKTSSEKIVGFLNDMFSKFDDLTETFGVEKIKTIVKDIYNADDIVADSKIRDQLKQFEKEGYGNFPICIAKTQYSFSTDPNLKGAPSNHSIPIREVRLCSGAEFIVVVCGEIMTMPGLPSIPAANSIYVNDDGEIEGLF